MIERSSQERFCVWWWDTEGEDWVQQVSKMLCWPVSVETDNVEAWQGGGA